ncbi:uncharacterized protein LOC114458612 isoform X2 [Gouania willdenowi]|nr:uncharacterized protein LOC114458612 isoform X2 [Gouania willdenowi]
MRAYAGLGHATHCMQDLEGTGRYHQNQLQTAQELQDRAAQGRASSNLEAVSPAASLVLYPAPPGPPPEPVAVPPPAVAGGGGSYLERGGAPKFNRKMGSSLQNWTLASLDQRAAPSPLLLSTRWRQRVSNCSAVIPLSPSLLRKAPGILRLFFTRPQTPARLSRRKVGGAAASTARHRSVSHAAASAAVRTVISPLTTLIYHPFLRYIWAVAPHFGPWVLTLFLGPYCKLCALVSDSRDEIQCSASCSDVQIHSDLSSSGEEQPDATAPLLQRLRPSSGQTSEEPTQPCSFSTPVSARVSTSKTVDG